MNFTRRINECEIEMAQFSLLSLSFELFSGKASIMDHWVYFIYAALSEQFHKNICRLPV